MASENRTLETGEARDHTHFVTEYLASLLRWKRAAALVFALIVLVAVIEAIVLPPIYQSQAWILPVGETPLMDNPTISALTEFSSFIDFSSWGVAGKAALISILDSDLLRSRVASDLDLVKRFGVAHPDSAIAVSLAGRQLRDKLSFSISKWDNIVIEAEGNDPEFPIAVLNSAIEQLRTIQNEMSLTTAKRTRLFIERRMREADDTYRTAQDALTAFQSRYGMVVVDEQQRAAVRMAADLETQLTLKRAELNAARTFFTGNNSRLRQIEAEVRALDSELTALKGGNSVSGEGDATSGNGTPSMSDFPDLGAQYVRLAMDVEIQQRLLTLLAEQYEQAKISEVREITSFEVIEPPRVPAAAKRTRRGVVLAGMLIGALAGLALPPLLDGISRYFPPAARRDAASLMRRLVSIKRAD